jgi:hypothetical protein
MLTTALSIFIDSQVYIKKQNKKTPTPKTKIKNKKKSRKTKNRKSKKVERCTKLHLIRYTIIKSFSFFFFNVRYNKINSFHELAFIICFTLPPNQAGF